MAVFVDPDKDPIYAGDAWVSKPYEFGNYAGTLGDGTPDPDSEFTPEDLTGYSGWSAQWRPDPESDDNTIELTVDTTQLVEGQLSVSADETQTRDMDGPGVYDVQATSPRVRTFYAASTSWTLDVTR